MFRLKYYSFSDKLGWRLSGVTALIFLLLGSISFGYGIKLMEYAEKKDVTPIFSAIPMLISGILGAGVALARKKFIVACYAISSTIVLMLSIHMNYRFMFKEYSLLPLYRRQCQTEAHTSESQHFCQHYTGTVMLCCVSVSMIPVALGSVLACLIDQKALNKKNLYLPWFTFSKVEPSDTNRKIRENSNNNKLMTFVKYKRSERIVGEIPETHPSNEYIPDIPDFMELAIPSSATSPAYKAYVANGFGESFKNAYSKSLNDLDTNAVERLYLKDGIKSVSNDLLITKNKPDGRSDVNLRFVDEDFFNQKNRKNMSSVEYYDNAAEDWIQNIVDNHTCRSRLHGVSDEEDLDSNSELLLDSTTKPFLSTHKNAAKDGSEIIEDLNNKNLSVSVTVFDNEEKINDTVKGLGNPDSPLNDHNQEFFSQEKNQYDGFSKSKRINVAINPRDLHPELVKEIDGTKLSDRTTLVDVKSDMIREDFSQDITPPGLITPVAGRSLPGGQLHFEFDKVSSTYSDNNMSMVAAPGHARKYWIEFEVQGD